MLTDNVLTKLDEDLEAAIEEQWDGAPEKEALLSLRADLKALGYFGLLVCLSEAVSPEAAVHTEHVDAIRKRLLQGLAGDPEAEVDLEAAPALPELIEQYKEAKGESGAKLTRRALENALFDFYDLDDHGMFVDDVKKCFDAFRAAAPPHEDIKDLIRKLAHMSSDTARFILGLFPEQLELIHRIGSRMTQPHELDRAFDDFGPGAIRMRLWAVTQTLLQREKRLRLAITLWARERGVAIGRDAILTVPEILEVKSTKKLIVRACEREAYRKELLAFMAERQATLDAVHKYL
ncbi:MAG: hypothetical protein ACYTFT_08575 [Planctomycetota bacterium]|jgi:hypothetical protein